MRTLSSILETSTASALTQPPLPWISAAAASAWERFLAAISTRAPRPAKTRAMPFPIPLLAPVTMTERPSIDVSMCDPVGFQDGVELDRFKHPVLLRVKVFKRCYALRAGSV